MEKENYDEGLMRLCPVKRASFCSSPLPCSASSLTPRKQRRLKRFADECIKNSGGAVTPNGRDQARPRRRLHCAG